MKMESHGSREPNTDFDVGLDSQEMLQSKKQRSGPKDKQNKTSHLYLALRKFIAFRTP